MEILTIDNFIDFSYIVALFFAAQFEKKYDFFGKVVKRNTSDKWKVPFIGLIHAGVWIFLLRPEGKDIKDQAEIILTSYLVTVVLYDYLLKKFLEKYKAE